MNGKDTQIADTCSLRIQEWKESNKQVDTFEIPRRGGANRIRTLEGKERGNGKKP